jgi:3-hydroxyacyl-CoA dehydrogenase/3a,7a,12a-trihydroxy-5b-cholest-24-enoyl-CoA hydratase
MANELRFDGRVAIVTGAGNGLGRSHALLLASRGARVVVNDLGGTHTGGGRSSAAADKVVEEIKALGGEATANYDSVEDGAKIVQTALDAFGRVDIVINNAGILRDVSFPKMSPDDWDLIYRVHVLGAYRVTAAAWPHLREQKFGRVIFTSSAAGIYGNFGQANYSMAKLGVVGLANTLAIEGRKANVLVNTIAPIAGSRMTETVLPKDLLDALKPEYVSALVAQLCHEGCDDTGGLFEVGGGFYSKLRWERTEGTTFRLGRPVTPEDLRARWGDVTDFAKATHPGSITESMQPIMNNVEAGPSRGGNEFIDVDAALGYEFPEFTSRHDERDMALYALGVGAGRDPLSADDLRYVYELGEDFQPLPTYPVVPVVNAILEMGRRGETAPGLSFGLDRVLHGEQYTELLAPWPAKAKLKHRSRIKAIYDKGKGAVVVNETKTFDESGNLLALNEVSTFVRGAGGFGGDRGPSSDVTVPDRAPDAVIEEKTAENQALLYRLSGDWNPLHADPNFAQAFGFSRPILHGLCSFGYAGRHVLKAFGKNDGRLFKSIRVRFADTVLPGETLVTEMWREGDKVVFRCKVKERDKAVITNAVVELHREVPTPKAKAAATAAPATGAVSSEPLSADIFEGMKRYLARNADVAAKIGKVYQFKLTAPVSEWTVDLKSNHVAPGETAKPECVLELSDADFMAMCTGKANPMKLFTSGKLKISGDVMASQKLDFLQKMDPKDVLDAMQARAGGATPGTPAQSGTVPDAGAKTGATSGDVFTAIGQYLQENPDVAKKIAKVYQFRLSNPESVWTLDLKANAVSHGEGAKPECTLELTDEDFMAMTSGKANPMKLFTTGKLKISGDVMASQKLDFLQKIDRAKMEAALSKAKTTPVHDAAPKPASAGRSAAAPGIFKALGERLAANPQLAGELGAVTVFTVLEPEGQWTVNGTAVTAGKGAGATAFITLSDGDLAALARAEADVKSLYQRGKLRVDGDVHVAHRLGILKGTAG